MGATKVILIASALVCLGRSTEAQDTLDFHSCTAQIGGGFSDVRGPDSHDLNRGWDFQAGGGFAVTGSFALTANFMIAKPGIGALPTTVSVNGEPATVTGGTARFYATTFDPTLRVYTRKWFNVYVLAGFGWFRRTIEFTGSSPATIEHPGGMELESVSANSGALNFGSGLNFRLPRGRGLRAFAEARYLHGLAVNHESTLIPVTFGIRW